MRHLGTDSNLAEAMTRVLTPRRDGRQAASGFALRHWGRRGRREKGVLFSFPRRSFLKPWGGDGTPSSRIEGPASDSYPISCRLTQPRADTETEPPPREALLSLLLLLLPRPRPSPYLLLVNELCCIISPSRFSAQRVVALRR